MDIKGEKVATVQDDGTVEANGKAAKIKTASETFMKEWKKQCGTEV